MKPHLKHIMYGDGTRKCGDTTRHDYVSNAFYRTLPECEKCFYGFKEKHPLILQHEERLANIERIVLRDFL